MNDLSMGSGSSKSARLAALRFHTLGKQDRRWLLSQLSQEEQNKLLAAYSALKRMKHFSRLEFQDVLDTLAQVDANQATEEASDVELLPLEAGIKVTPTLMKVLLSLPDDWLTIIAAEGIVSDFADVVRDMPPARQRKIKQAAGEQVRPIADPVRKIVLDYLTRASAAME